MSKEPWAHLHILTSEQIPTERTSLDTQIGGSHYKSLAIQPMVYSEANKLTPLEHTAIKYITRNRLKGKGKEDIEKAIHCCQMILDMYYSGGDSDGTKTNI